MAEQAAIYFIPWDSGPRIRNKALIQSSFEAR